LATTGDHWRPLATSGASPPCACIRARWRQRSPVVASGRQLEPVGARGCQRVPGGSGFNWRPLATTGDHWRPVAPCARIRAWWRQRSPVVASGRQWSPVGARGCQGVPGGSGFNWRPLATTGDHWRPVAPLLRAHAYAPGGDSGRQWSPVVASWNQLVPEGARGCQGVLASIGDHWRPLATSGDQWRLSSVRTHTRPVAPAVASGRQWSPVGTSWCQRVPEGARGFWLQLATTGDHWRPVVTSGAGHRLRSTAAQNSVFST